MRRWVHIVGTAVGWGGFAVFLAAAFWDIFVNGEHMTKGQILLNYWPILAVAVVAGVAGDMAKRTAKSDGSSKEQGETEAA